MLEPVTRAFEQSRRQSLKVSARSPARRRQHILPRVGFNHQPHRLRGDAHPGYQADHSAVDRLPLTLRLPANDQPKGALIPVRVRDDHFEQVLARSGLKLDLRGAVEADS